MDDLMDSLKERYVPALSFTTKTGPAATDLVNLCEQASELCGMMRAMRYLERQGTARDTARAEYILGDVQHRFALLEEVLGTVLRSAFPTESAWADQLERLEADVLESFTHQRQIKGLMAVFSPEERAGLAALLTGTMDEKAFCTKAPGEGPPR